MSSLLEENLPAGNHSLLIDKNELASGVYMLQVKQKDEIIVKRLVIE
jgi:hypothetical protein